ncbi:MAG TPA: caspase family protein [Lacibacter sp.]|nr:caspase family protein [Lacibacter sp.]
MKPFFIGFCLLLSSWCFAQDKHALIIGIDQYRAPAGYRSINGRSYFQNLKGCKNDANSMYAVLRSRFQFQPGEIDSLFDNSATRQGILEAMNRLLTKCKAGDYAIIYYAGHGSTVKNSLSFEVDKTDQSIVPSDTWKEGVHDIRDKELSVIFNRFIDKNVKLTVIFDCCHSGSMARGPNLPSLTSRFFPGENWDAKDPTRSLFPEEREGGLFLIMSASQSNELADEMYDGDIPHGAFTLALIKAIQQQSVNESALNLFLAARAILKSQGSAQEPVIGGSEERQQQTLFGMQKGTGADYAMIPVTGIIENKVQLQGGFAIGLYAQNELTMFNAGGDTLVQLVVDTVTGINSSIASIKKGKPEDIQPGMFFRVTNWVATKKPLLNVYMPSTGVTDSILEQFTKTVQQLKASSFIRWMPVYSKGAPNPYTSVFWNQDRCYIRSGANDAVELVQPTVDSIISYCKKDSALYVELPVTNAQLIAYKAKMAQNKNISIVSDPAQAQYSFYGRIGDKGMPAYGFRKKYITGKDSLESLPLTTDCFELPAPGVTKNIADSLYDRITKISKIRGWLNLETPDASRNSFGYHLELYNQKTKKRITSGTYKIGDSVTLKLVADAELLAKPEAYSKKYYIYVFAVDQSGAMYLYYPGNDGNVTNQFPKLVNEQPVKEINLIGPYKVPPPSGTDHYFLLACEEPINNAKLIFNQQSIYTGIGTRDTNNPLSGLLDMGNANKRSSTPEKLAANWSLRTYSFTCTY